jgi:hypothetical protein
MGFSSLTNNAWDTPHQELLFETADICKASSGLLNGSRFDTFVDQHDPIGRFTPFTYWFRGQSVNELDMQFNYFLPSSRHPNGSPKERSPMISKVQKLNQETMFAGFFS